VTLTATPASGWAFAGWSGDITSSDNPLTITMDANISVTATFTQDQYTLDVSVVGNGTVEPDTQGQTYPSTGDPYCHPCFRLGICRLER